MRRRKSEREREEREEQMSHKISACVCRLNCLHDVHKMKEEQVVRHQFLVAERHRHRHRRKKRKEKGERIN